MLINIQIGRNEFHGNEGGPKPPDWRDRWAAIIAALAALIAKFITFKK